MAKQVIYQMLYELMMILITSRSSQTESDQHDAVKPLDLDNSQSLSPIRVPGSYPAGPDLSNIAQELVPHTAKANFKDEGTNQKRPRPVSMSHHAKKVETIHDQINSAGTYTDL